MVRFVLDDDKVYKVVAESEDAIWVVDYDNPCAPKIVKQDGMKNLKEIPVPDDYIQESVVSRAIYDTARKRLGILSAILSDNAYITNAALRQRALAKIAQDARVSQKTLKRWYYSYLAYGERGLYPVSKIKPLLRGKGVVDKTSLERNQPDYAQQAILDIEEYTKVVIECVLYYNDSHVQKKYERSQAMIEQGVPPIASELWKFYDAQTSPTPAFRPRKLYTAVRAAGRRCSHERL